MSFRDPVHGQIELGTGPWAVEIEKLLDTEPLTRLRRIRQLGFASFVFPMADHSRFTHALGSFHVAGQLAEKVLNDDDLDTQIEEIFADYPSPGAASGGRLALKAHVQVAALLQDIGELPFENSLKGLYRPNDELRDSLSDWDLGTVEPDSKMMFTLACVRVLDQAGAFTLLNSELVVLLISKALTWTGADIPLVGRLRNILDSPLDADRIDYVFRDALLTIGAIGNPGQLVDSIRTYERDHVVISNPAHAGALLMTRNYLYRSVYLDPTKRLKERALHQLLVEIANSDKMKASWVPAVPPGEVSLSSFLSLDDVSVLASVEALRSLTGVTEAARFAMNTLRGESRSSYKSLWVAPNSTTIAPATSRLPAGILVDTRDDYLRLGSVPTEFFRVDSEYFAGGTADQTIAAWIPEIVATELAPAPSSILTFIPTDLAGPSRRAFEAARDNGSLFSILRRKVMEDELALPGDTRSTKGFTGPAIHISWCWKDLDAVRAFVKVLFDMRRQYYLLLDPFEGLAAPTKVNSVDLISKAPLLLIFSSDAYLSRRESEPNGNIEAELLACHERVLKGPPLPTVVLAIDDWKRTAKGFPWSMIGMGAPPYLGKAVLDCNPKELLELVGDAVSLLDTGAV